jgi:hypothetical protein
MLLYILYARSNKIYFEENIFKSINMELIIIL